jgi:hypothetical protein
MIIESIMGKVEGNATIFYEWPGLPTDGGSYAEAENTARRMALKIFSEHKPYLNFFILY